MANDAFYTQLVQDIAPVIEEYGTVYNVRSKNAFDEATMTTGTGVPRQVKGVNAGSFIADELGSDVGGANVGGVNTLGHKSLILEASGDIKQDDEVEVDGTWYSCDRLETVKPGNVVVLYVVTLYN